MVVVIKRSGEIVATCYGSKILGLSAEDEAKLFIQSYKKVFGVVIVNGEKQ